MISEDILIRRIQTRIPRDAPVVPVSLPVTSFGNPHTARIATIGINPSSAEFCSQVNIPLEPEKKRFVDREVLGIGPHEIPTREQALRVLEGNHNYFKTGNAYKKWFDPMQKWVLNPLDVSYEDGSAVHLDLVQWATEPLWDKIDKSFDQLELITNDREFLNQVLLQGKFDLVVLNGKTVLKHMAEMKLFHSVFSEKVSFTKDNGMKTSVTFTIGHVNGAPAIGWSANIPDSYCPGPTKKVVSDWISSALNQDLIGRELGKSSSLPENVAPDLLKEAPEMADDFELEYKKRLATSQQKCVICEAPVLEMRRYPRYVCANCEIRAVDSEGREIYFTDSEDGDSLTMHFRDKTKADVYIHHPSATGFPHAWIDGIELEVRVAHFGGVVMQTLDWRDHSSYFTKK